MPKSSASWYRRPNRLWMSLIPYLGLLETPFVRSRAHELLQPCLFILGLPRSGTTLVYQYIVHRLRLAYLTNMAGHYYLSPCLITYLQRQSLDGYSSDFRSQYGKVHGSLAPREAGAFWGRFFGFEEYMRFQDVSQKDVQTLRNTISCVQRLFGNVPFVNKNVKHMLRINALSHIFLNSIFLLVERDLPQVALSMIRARYFNLEDPKQWYSVKPLNYTDLEHQSIPEQIVNQLTTLHLKMNSDLSELPPERVLRLQYEKFCQKPETVIKQLDEVLEKIEYRNAEEPAFNTSRSVPKTDEEFQLMSLINNYSKGL